MIPKFRAWDKVINQMFIPDSIHFDSKGMVDGIGSKETIFGIEDFELMQSTGLHDKNGIEIYEGDIVNVKGTYIDDLTNEVVEYCRTRAYYDVGSFMLGDFDTDKIEVVGNIHEHPELLEKDGE